MDKEGFEKMYIHLSNITPEFYVSHFVTLECHCDNPLCRGWAAVSNNPQSIESHNKLYGQTASLKPL